MSWGERSCTKYGNCKICTVDICDVDCEEYVWDKVKEPDSKPFTVRPKKTYKINFKKSAKKLKQR